MYQKILFYNFVFGQKQYKVIKWHTVCPGRCYCLLFVADVICTVHCIHNTTSSNEKLFAGQEGSLTLQSLYANAQGMQHFSINSLLHLRTVKDKCGLLYKELITQLHIYTAAIRILAKGYLPFSLITPLKLKEILSEVRITVQKTNPDYDLVIQRLHPYYDMN